MTAQLLLAGHAAVTAAEDGSMALTSGPADHQVFQRNEFDVADLHFSGTCALFKQGIVEARILDQLTLLSVSAWQKVGEYSGQKWQASLTKVPMGGPYRIEIRLLDSTGKIDAATRIDNILIGDIWVLAGQSNMQGAGELHDVELPSVWVNSFGFNEKWSTAVEPLHWLLDSIDPIHHPGITGEALERERESQKRRAVAGAGCGLPFAKEVVQETRVPIGLLPCAHGGTKMEQWDPAKRDEQGNSLYGSMYRRFLAVGGKVKGLLWYQGESDANEIDGPLFRNRFIDFVKSVRQDFKQADLPVYFVQISRIVAKDVFPQWNEIREQQRQCAAAIPNCRMASSIDLTFDDPVHISTQGHKRLGRRLAMLALRDLYGKTEWQHGPELNYLTPVPSRFKQYRMHFKGVNKTLQAVDRPSGFSVRDQKEKDLGLLYKTLLAPDGKSIDLFLFDQPPPGSCLWYGYGLDPYCNITDSEDMALAAFGPIPFDSLMYAAFVDLLRNDPASADLPALIPHVLAFAEKHPAQEREIYAIVKRTIKTLPAENQLVYYPLLFKTGDFEKWDEWLASAGRSTLQKRKQIAQSFQGEDGLHLKTLYVHNWHMVGLFDNAGCRGFDQVFAPETGSHLERKYLNTKGDTLCWMPAQVDSDGLLNFKKLWGNHEYVVVYAQAGVEAKKAVQIPLLLGSDDAAVVWVNGNEIHREHVHRRVTCSSDLLFPRFNKGKNTILIKVCQRTGDWGLCVRLLDKDNLITQP